MKAGARFFALAVATAAITVAIACGSVDYGFVGESADAAPDHAPAIDVDPADVAVTAPVDAASDAATDALDAAALPSCKAVPGQRATNGHCFFTQPFDAGAGTKLTWQGAEDSCEFHGGHLVTFNETDQAGVLAQLELVAIDRPFWIGLRAPQDQPTEDASVWRWIPPDGDAAVVSKWADGFPDEKGVAAYVKPAENRWRNETAGAAGFTAIGICEIDRTDP